MVPQRDGDALRVAMRLSTEVMCDATEMVVRYYDKFVEGEERYAAANRKARKVVKGR